MAVRVLESLVAGALELRGKLGAGKARLQAVRDKLEASFDEGPFEPLDFRRGPAQTSLFVDQQNGSDDGAGTEDDPFESWEQVLDALGGRFLESFYTVTIVGNYQGDIHANFRCKGAWSAFSGGVILAGTETTVASAAVDAATAHDDAARVMGTLDSASVDFSLHVGKKIVLTSGAHQGAYAWVLRDLGAGSAMTGPFWDPSSLSQVAPAAGDGFDLVSQSRIDGSVVVTGGSTVFGLDSIHIRSTATASTAYVVDGARTISDVGSRIEGPHPMRMVNTFGTATGMLFETISGDERPVTIEKNAEFQPFSNAYACRLDVRRHGRLRMGEGATEVIISRSTKGLFLNVGGLVLVKPSSAFAFDGHGGSDVVTIRSASSLELATGAQLWAQNATTSHGMIVEAVSSCVYTDGPSQMAFATPTVAELSIGGDDVAISSLPHAAANQAAVVAA